MQIARNLANRSSIMTTSTWTDSSTHEVLKKTFGFNDFRPGQKAPVDDLLAGHDVFCVMPTGAGKSLIYQVPALLLDGITIVISPLIALMQDQVSALQLLGVPAVSINSAQQYPDNITSWEALRSGSARLVYMAPERLMSENTLNDLKAMNISLFAIDEAHCISQWGPSFRPEYEMLTGLKTHFPEVPVVALTASADAATRHDIAEKLFSGKVRQYVAGFDRPNISLAVEPKLNWKTQMKNFVLARRGQSGIVYCLSRKKTEDAARALRDEGISAIAYHAGLDKQQRHENQLRFVKEPGIVMTATIAFGMGIDKPDVRFVFHTDLPSSMEAYYQEFGRAGRDGDPADAHMLYGLDDIRMRRMFIENDTSNDTSKRREHKRLDALLSYCEAPSCRRQTLLSYFGDDSDPCNNCDNCNNPVELVTGTREGQMVLSAMVRTGQRFGPAHIIDIVVGAKTAKIAQLRHDELPTYGVGAEHSKNQWRSIVRQMTAAGFIHLDIAEFGGLSVTEKGRLLLKGEISFEYRPEKLKPLRAARKAKPVIAEQPLADTDRSLLDRLKELRMQLAKARNVPAYVIFHDKTLRQIASHRPKTLDDLSQLHGIGEAKLKQFGKDFLELVRQFEA